VNDYPPVPTGDSPEQRDTRDAPIHTVPAPCHCRACTYHAIDMRMLAMEQAAHQTREAS